MSYEQTYPMSDQQIWDAHYRHIVGPGVMTNRQVADWYAQLEATKTERRNRPPEPAVGRRKGKRGKQA